MSDETPTIGDNSNGQIKSLVERIEQLEREKADTAEDIKSVYAEGKSAGFDVKILRKLIARRKRDAAEIEAEETMLDLYLRALA